MVFCIARLNNLLVRVSRSCCFFSLNPSRYRGISSSGQNLQNLGREFDQGSRPLSEKSLNGLGVNGFVGVLSVNIIQGIQSQRVTSRKYSLKAGTLISEFISWPELGNRQCKAHGVH